MKYRKGFNESEEGKAIRYMLQRMTRDSSYNTAASYSADGDTYPDHLMPFTDKHMNYLNAHPDLDADRYLANIKLMSRIR